MKSNRVRQNAPIVTIFYKFWTYVLNDSTILSERIKEDYETKRVLNFDSVLNEHNSLLGIKRRL